MFQVDNETRPQNTNQRVSFRKKTKWTNNLFFIHSFLLSAPEFVSMIIRCYPRALGSESNFSDVTIATNNEGHSRFFNLFFLFVFLDIIFYILNLIGVENRERKRRFDKKWENDVDSYMLT